MTIEQEIARYIAEQPEAKRADVEALHRLVMGIAPATRLWYFDGLNEEGKVVTNPTIGYGQQTMQYANGKTRDWFRIGVSAVQTGISVYILGIEDKKFLAEKYGKDLGKASVTGYCIKFKTLNDIKVDVLASAIQYGLELES